MPRHLQYYRTVILPYDVSVSSCIVGFPLIPHFAEVGLGPDLRAGVNMEGKDEFHAVYLALLELSLEPVKLTSDLSQVVILLHLIGIEHQGVQGEHSHIVV